MLELEPELAQANRSIQWSNLIQWPILLAFRLTRNLAIATEPLLAPFTELIQHVLIQLDLAILEAHSTRRLFSSDSFHPFWSLSFSH